METSDTARPEAFSDGVSVIAATPLALDLKVLHDLPHGQALGPALLRQWPTYGAYVTFFSTIQMVWTNHHSTFRHIRRTDNALSFINGLLSLMVITGPFPTSLVAQPLHGPANNRTAVLIYSGRLLAILFNALRCYAVQGGESS